MALRKYIMLHDICKPICENMRQKAFVHFKCRMNARAYDYLSDGSKNTE